MSIHRQRGAADQTQEEEKMAALTARQLRNIARRESEQRIAVAQAEPRRIVATGTCTQCGSALRRNLALTGWWQCAQSGSVGFRADASLPSCSWQGFTQ